MSKRNGFVLEQPRPVSAGAADREEAEDRALRKAFRQARAKQAGKNVPDPLDIALGKTEKSPTKKGLQKRRRRWGNLVRRQGASAAATAERGDR